MRVQRSSWKSEPWPREKDFHFGPGQLRNDSTGGKFAQAPQGARLRGLEGNCPCSGRLLDEPPLALAGRLAS